MSEPTAVMESEENDAFSNDPTLPRYSQSFADEALQLAKDPPPMPAQLTVSARRARPPVERARPATPRAPCALNPTIRAQSSSALSRAAFENSDECGRTPRGPGAALRARR